ncbi:unnamed protein product [Ectocarpus sp. 6 AP-2014]
MPSPVAFLEALVLILHKEVSSVPPFGVKDYM